MTNELAKTEPAKSPNALQAMALRLAVDPKKLLDTLKSTAFKEAKNDAQIMALVVVANEYGLNPFTKEIYAFPGKGGEIVPVVSVDGWIRMCNDHPTFDGMEFTSRDDDNGKVFSTTCTIHRSDRAKPITVTEYFEECFRSTDPWKSHPRRMLRHRALMQCARIAFGFSGVVDEDQARERQVEGKVVDMDSPLGGGLEAPAQQDRSETSGKPAKEKPAKTAQIFPDAPKPGKETAAATGLEDHKF